MSWMTEARVGPFIDVALGETIQIGEGIKLTFSRIKHESGELKIQVRVEAPAFVQVVKVKKGRRSANGN